MTIEPEYLTKEQIEKMPDGTFVQIIWAGGNGPGRWQISTDGCGYTVVQMYSFIQRKCIGRFHHLEKIGTTKQTTRVWLDK